MLRYNKIDNKTYRLSIDPIIIHNTTHSVITECSDPACVYHRSSTDIRERFEKKIHQFIGAKTNVKILFYASFMLYQELRILALIGNRISEVHLTDFAYNKLSDESKNVYNNAFVEYLTYIDNHGLETKVYVHTDPNNLVNSSLFNRQFDIICGIDIDYAGEHNNHRSIMKNIAKNTLKNDGMMCVSQNFTDQVDLCHYELDNNGNIKLVNADDYVKPPYYAKYMVQHIINKIYYPLLFIAFVFICLSFKESQMGIFVALTYVCLTTIARCMEYQKNTFNRNIINLLETTKNIN